MSVDQLHHLAACYLVSLPSPGEDQQRRRLNDKASHGQLNVYKLIQLLHAEAALVQLNLRLLSEGHTMRLQRSIQ